MRSYNFVAFDIGINYGRTMLATITNGKIIMKELTRFPNRPFLIATRDYWDIYALYNSIEDGLKAVSKEGVRIDGIGVNSWGADFIFIGYDRTFLNLPRSFRDPHTEEMPELFFQIMPERELYFMTGMQAMHFNTLFQLYACKMEYSSGLENSKCFLFVTDALSFLLTNKMVCEYTIASTTQLMDPWKRRIIPKLLEVMDLSPSLFLDLVPPGTIIANLQESAQRECNLWGRIPVIAVAGHNRASAVVAIPAEDEHFAYLSLEAQSFMGIEVKEPIVNEESFRMNFSNEGGVDGTTCFLKNITGLWLLDQCRKEWERNGICYSYSQMIDLARSADTFCSFIDPDDPRFTNPHSMTAAINDYCRSTNQAIPQNYGSYIRCIFESLALKYKYVFENLKQIAPFEINKLHVIGEGSHNKLLNQFIADTTGILVESGPADAIALGNAMVQAKTVGAISSFAQIRKIIRNSYPPVAYHPQDTGKWKEPYNRFLQVTGL